MVAAARRPPVAYVALDLKSPVAGILAAARPTRAELVARKRSGARRDLYPAGPVGILAAELVARLKDPSDVSAAVSRGPRVSIDLLLQYATTCRLELELHPLDIQRPLASLVELVGPTQTAAAGRVGVSQTALSLAVGRGCGVGLELVLRYATASGLIPELRARPKKSTGGRS